MALEGLRAVVRVVAIDLVALAVLLAVVVAAVLGAAAPRGDGRWGWVGY